MAINEVKMTTYTCDLPFCTNEQVVGGEDPGAIVFEMGWELGHPFFDDAQYDLCPIHVKELKSWLKGDDPQYES